MNIDSLSLLDFWTFWITNIDQLEAHLGLDPAQIRRDPWCRYL